MNNDYNNLQPHQTPRQSADEPQNYPANSCQQPPQPYRQYPYNQNNPNNTYRRPEYMPPSPLPQPGSGLATASMICGIFSLVFFCTGPFAIVGVILGIAAVITASCAKKKGFVGGMAAAGLATGIVGIILSALVFISCIACIRALGGSAKRVISEECPDAVEDWDYDWYDWNYDWENYV